jgi:flavin-dependent dehydrogenase
MASEKDRKDRYDVAIVGAGPAGAASASLLARSGWRVALLDKATFPRDKPCAEYLSPAAEPLLRELGVLDSLLAIHPGRLRGFRIYAPNGRVFQGDFAATRDANGHSYFETGLAVPRLRLDAALVQTATAAGAELREDWRLAQLTRDADGWTLTPSGEREPVRARLLLAADGVHSTVARRLNLHIPTRMRKVALVAHMRGIAGLADYGEMHVANRRYVGLAPLESPDSGEHGDLCNVAMVVDEARDGRRLAGRPQDFLIETLASFPRLRGRLDHLTIVRRTLTISRICVKARRRSDDGMLLVGDAGGYYDPFTGEGIYRALRGAQLAAQVANAALEHDDLSANILAQYEHLLRAEFRGKRTVERIIQAAVQAPPLMNHIAAIMNRRPAMADTVVAVTGDFLPASAVLRPGYLLRLIV